ncbi:MAG: DeoR/GlpR family DNA-binding transcription regulator [Candidatus Merdivicinus sp.]
MLQNERIEWILRQLQLRGTLKVGEISEYLQVSVDTVRRDLKLMEQNGQIKCVHGGACLPDPLLSIASFTARKVVHEDQKQQAAAKAVRYIQRGDIIALNSGTTNTVLAREIARNCEGITVVTNNLAAAEELMKNPLIQLILVGGEVDHTERSTYGAQCEKEFGSYYPDICFLSINAVNEENGYTDFRLNEIGVIQTLASCSGQVIAVMDSSKLGKRSKKNVLSLEQVDRLIMDEQVPEEMRTIYRDCGVVIE